MSVIVKLTELSPQQLIKIRTDLIIQPKKAYNPSQKWYNKSAEKEESVTFYISTNDYVKLPYSYGCRYILGSNPNMIKKFPFVSFEFNPDKYLLEDQVTMAEEALAHLDEHMTANLYIYTGCGKTVLAAWLACQRPGLTVILVNKKALIRQWKKTFKTFTTAKVWASTDKTAGEADVFIFMKTALANIAETNPEFVNQIENLIIDEAHTFCTDGSVGSLLACSPKRIIVCTATPKKENDLFKMMDLISGEHNVRKISSKPFNVFKFETGINVPMKKNVRKQPDWSRLVKDLCTDQTRNNIIIDLVIKNPECKILILTWSADHVVYLNDALNRMNIKTDYMTGKKNTYVDSSVLVGTFSKIGTGFDEETSCDTFNGVKINLLLLVGSMKNPQLLEQVAGRVFRSAFPQIIHFVDDNKIIERHWKIAEKWYKSRNGTIGKYQSVYKQGLEEGIYDADTLAELHFRNIMDTLSASVASTSLTASTSDNIILNIIDDPPAASTASTASTLNEIDTADASTSASDSIILNVIDPDNAKAVNEC